MSKHQNLKFGNNRKTYKELRQYDEEESHKLNRNNKHYDKRLEHALKVKDVKQLMRLEEEY
jgi:hypothetical protein